MKRLIVNAAHTGCGLFMDDQDDAIRDTSDDGTDFEGLGDIQNEADDDDADGVTVNIQGRLTEPPLMNFQAPKTRRKRQREAAANADYDGLPEPPDWVWKDRAR